MFQSAEKPCKREKPIFLFTGSCGVERFSLRRSPVNTKIRFSCLHDLAGSTVSVSVCNAACLRDAVHHAFVALVASMALVASAALVAVLALITWRRRSLIPQVTATPEGSRGLKSATLGGLNSEG